MQLTNGRLWCLFAVMRFDGSLTPIKYDTSGASNTSVEVKKHACSAKCDIEMVVVWQGDDEPCEWKAI